jgi:hypothetical protein
MDTGVSLDDDLGFQVITKYHIHLASQKNKMRQSNNPDWYAWKTVGGIIQAAGRGIRSKIMPILLS